MFVKLLTSLSGPNVSKAPNDLHECDADEAQRLIEAGFAVATNETVVETAVPGRLVERAVKTRRTEAQS